ncbi:MAG TPA: glycosyltransferase [Candidatus Binataceae bacterium]|nr:glycosyltransferase [Candidatus Binataceae bacterium]
MRVLQVGKFYPPHMGGIETHLQDLCGELSRSISVRVLVANDSRRHCDEIVDGLRVTRLAPLFNVSTAPVCPRMAPEIRRARADLVHLHLPNPATMLACFASAHRGRLVLTWHSDVLRPPVITRALAPLERLAIRRAGACIVTSHRYLESSPLLSEHRARCRVIPYGIPCERFAQCDTAAVARIRARFGTPLLLAVGRLTYYKGFEFLIHAMRYIDAHLLLIGDGPLRQMLEGDARALGVSPRVSFLGEIHNRALSPYYHAADVFVLPSVARSEAFGIVQLEAMASGVPVVNTRIDSGVPSVSLDGTTGLTVPPCAPEPLAAAINCLLDDPPLRARYGAAGRRRVAEEFTLDQMARRTLDVYCEILSRPCGRSAA